MARVFYCLCGGLALAACSSPLFATSESALGIAARAEQVHANTQIIFAHDHQRDTEHLQGAIDGGMTAMTIELIVDRMQWVDVNQDPVTTCCTAAYQWPIVENAARLRFDAALMDLQQVIDGFEGR